ncbi:hsp70-binding protein 1 [Zerene cesonia]|uniref:hsp70-binding protein 1 n=1 Tax=Zerene cesonia TaxID=33412 RepID=UPI0018E4E6DC|nr:hsp70-binding protein 1 [Zerene cesonia]
MDQNNEENRPSIAGALTFPSRNEQPVIPQPRQPRNLQGLLRFAMEATKAEDAPGNSQFGPMDEERRKFLEEALKSITVNVAEVLQNGIKVLTDSEKIKGIQLGESLPEDVDVAFNNVLEYIDDIDVANDFYKMGGFAMFPICYSSENEEVRSRASQILSELCQNNPYCQARALECGLLNVVLHLASTERGQVLAKCVSAISAATREFEPACRELTAQGGCETLTHLLGSDCPSIAKTRAAFLVAYLCQHYPDAREKFIELNIARTIAEQVKSGRDNTTEHLLSILHSLLGDSRVKQQCQDPALDLKKVLEEHSKRPELEEEYIEEKQYCKSILKILDGLPQVEVVNNEIDR